ncbi:MAG: hypothetical protein NZ555_04080 [Geminicoccaceae bacterium]|nr:hypothetical protein [Geminicoccaceae bacterium]MCX8100913.1 hypothetical protein [Geminicoccaceae bacterium]MDW8368660.1 hypothetical protein [Geminicoccaceae bacterium]
MFTLSFGKILVVVLVIVAAWKGLRLLGALQKKLEQAQRQPPAPTAGSGRATETTDLVQCPRCGTWVPNGTWCPSVDECRIRRT